jgi:hypothetical protein
MAFISFIFSQFIQISVYSNLDLFTPLGTLTRAYSMLCLRFRFQYLFAFTLSLATLGALPARAQSLPTQHQADVTSSMGLDFNLPEHHTIAAVPKNASQPLPSDTPPVTSPVQPPRYEPLAIPQSAIYPPTKQQPTDKSNLYSHPSNQVAPQTFAEGIGGTTGIGIEPSQLAQTDQTLPPPPPLPPMVVSAAPALPPEAAPVSRVIPPTNASNLAVQFDDIPTSDQPTPEPQHQQGTATPVAHTQTVQDFQWIFRGGSDSLVARTIGSAEGTRTADGSRTRAFYGHTDPGNGVWNIGTFSYQHGASSPEAADDKQLARLQRQGKVLDQKAQIAGLEMSLDETLNGLDLANQSPRAALERGGYIERLTEARERGLSGADAILWARTYSYMDPDTEQWNAPGLGNTTASITRDQDRRLRAIDRALDSYNQQNPPVNQTAEISIPTSEPPPDLTQPIAPATQASEVPVASSPPEPFSLNLAKDPQTSPKSSSSLPPSNSPSTQS